MVEDYIHHMYGLKLVTAAVSEPVSTATLKSHLRLNTTDEDTLLAMHISSAREMFENLTDRACLTSTWDLSMDAFPKVVRLPKSPLQSVTSVQYYDSTNTLVTWNSSNYSVDIAREPGRIVPKVWFPDWRIFPVYPPLSYQTSPKIVVRFVAGWTTDTIPSLVKQGILLLAAHFYSNRSETQSGKLESLPNGFQAIVSQYKTGWISNMNPPMYNPNDYGYAVE